jgi:hypothetical protein
VIKLTHVLVLLGATGAVLAPVTFGSTRSADGLGTPGSAPGKCRTKGPVLLRSGAGPRSRLRVDLATIAGTRGRVIETEQVTQRTKLASGATQKVSSTRKTTAVLTLGAIANGRIPIAGKYHVRAKNSLSSAAQSGSFTNRGFLDALNGGAWGTVKGKGGTPVSDHFPVTALGVGASWRVVNCDPVDETPAKETRTYVLRSVANGVVAASFTDDVEIDGAHVDLGTEKVNGSKLHIKLVALHGSSKGVMRLPLSNGLRLRTKTVTQLTASVQVTTDGTPGPIVSTNVVDTVIDAPSV